MIECDEDGRFDGALLFDRYNEFRGPEGIVCTAHRGDRLGLVRNRGTYFKAEFLHKFTAEAIRGLVWDEMRSPLICETEAEARVEIQKFVDGDV
jgi:hypothetical protein